MSSSVSRYVIDTCLSRLVRHLFMCFVGVVFIEAVGHTLCVVQECSWLLVADP